MPRSAKLNAWDIYAKELRDLGYGHPLWVPKPSPESGEVQLGDVGYLSQGKFCFLFNCMRGADDPVNRKGVPALFEVFIPPDGPVEESAKTIRDYIQDRLLLSDNARSVGVTAKVSLGQVFVAIACFMMPDDSSNMDPLAHVEGAMSYEVKQKTGAYLALKRPAHQTNLHCTEAIFRYLRNHHFEWLTFAIERRGRKIDSQHILFVSGFVKTAVWAVGAFRHESSSATLKIDAGAMFGGGVSASAGGAMSLSNCSAPLPLHRNGPAERLPWNDDALHSDDQCVFLQYAHLKPRRFARGLANCVEPVPHGLPIAHSEDDENMGSSSLEDGSEHVGDQVASVVSSRNRVFLHDRPGGTEAHGADNSDSADESYRAERQLSPDKDHVRLDIRRDPVSNHEESSLGLSSLPNSLTPRDVLDSEVDNSDASGHRVALQEREEAIEVRDGNGSGDDDESEDDELDEVDEVALDYILAHSDCSCACASTQDLYLFRQARHVRGEAPDRNSSGVHAA